jgi:hypothetical protein
MELENIKERDNKVSNGKAPYSQFDAQSKKLYIGCMRAIRNIFGKDKSRSSTVESPAYVPSAVPPHEQIRKERIKRNFSAWDGSHLALQRLVMKSMNDMNSYAHDSTSYWDKGDHLLVETSFTDKNASGEMVNNIVTAKVDLDGNVIEIISRVP